VFQTFDANKSRFLELDEFSELLECFWLKHRWGDEFEERVRSEFDAEKSECEGLSLDDFLGYYNSLVDL
jgi:hypothetical protein